MHSRPGYFESEDYYDNNNPELEFLIKKLTDLGIEDIPALEAIPNKDQRFGKNSKYSIKYDGEFWYFKDWSREFPGFIWSPDLKENLSSEERKKLYERLKIKRDQREVKLKSENDEASKKATNMWYKLSTYGYSKYLENKKLAEIDNIRFGSDPKGNFIATSLIDENYKISTLQKIYDDGSKTFLPGGRKYGCYSHFGNLNSNLIYVCEGVATGMTILLAKPESLVIIAYDCGNIKPVITNILKHYESATIIIAGDNDLTSSQNSGKKKAEEAAIEFNLKMVLPIFQDTSSDPSDFNDLYQLEKLEEVRNQLDKADYIKKSIEWDAPILFHNPQTPDINAKILPSPLREFAEALADSTETPEGMSVMAILAVLATTLQRKVQVQPRQGDGYKENVNLYTITTLLPGNRKSTIVNLCNEPLLDWEQEKKKILEPEIIMQESLYESKKKLISNMQKGLKENNPDTLQKIAKLTVELKEPEKLPLLSVNDSTLESLAAMIHEQKGKLAILSDEGGIVETVSGLYSGGQANIDILLKSWDGGHVRIKRQNKYIDMRPMLTINLTVQPIIIKNLSDKKAFSGKGLLERFLYCLPKSKMGYRTHDRPPVPTKVRNEYKSKITELINISCDEPIVLVLSQEAYKKFHEFQHLIEKDLRPGGRLNICLGWGGKIPGQALRIAGLFHMVEHGIASKKISEATMINSLELCSLLTVHAIAAFGGMEVDSDIREVKEILHWIQENNFTSFIKSDLTKKMQNKIKAQRIDELLNILIQRNIISSVIKEGKKTERYNVNPMIY